jgi:hypothetical protein
MKFLPIFALMAIAIVPNAAQAQFTVTIGFDEDCNGTFQNSAGFSSPLPCALAQDLGPGGLQSALIYDILNPPGLTAGDLFVLDAADSTLSDIIRFNPDQVGSGGGTGVVVFYSASPGASLADTGFPGALYTNALPAFETTLPSGATGLSYTPTAGQPGFVTGAGGPVTYLITSDAAPSVPEPASAVLLLMGGGFLFVRRRLASRPH